MLIKTDQIGGETMSQRTKGAICALMAALLTVGAAVAFCMLVSLLIQAAWG